MKYHFKIGSKANVAMGDKSSSSNQSLYMLS